METRLEISCSYPWDFMLSRMLSELNSCKIFPEDWRANDFLVCISVLV